MKKSSECEFARLHADEFVDEVLEPELHERIETHLMDCEPCADHISGLKAVTQILSSAKVQVADSPVDSYWIDNVLRQVRLSLWRRQVSFWMPALVGGLIALLATFGLAQVLSGTPAMNRINRPSGEARNEQQSRFPSLTLPNDFAR